MADSGSINIYLRKIVDEFKTNLKDRRFLNVLNPPVHAKVKSDFFLAQDFYLESMGAIPRSQIIMLSPQVPSRAKDIHFRI